MSAIGNTQISVHEELHSVNTIADIRARLDLTVLGRVDAELLIGQSPRNGIFGTRM